METVKKAENIIYKHYWHFSINTCFKKVLQIIEISTCYLFLTVNSAILQYCSTFDDALDATSR